MSFEPNPFTAVMMASAMPAAIRPYSMAVAPDSSFTKREMRLMMVISKNVAGQTDFGLAGVCAVTMRLNLQA